MPHLILQPVVENAIQHAIAPRATHGRIDIAAKQRNRMLQLEVRDNGPGIDSKESGAELRGVGLSNVQARLDQIYGADFEYDPKSGDVMGKGQVQMDLEANPEGLLHPDQATPKELKNPVHLTTTNLLFNQKTGNALTHEKVEFSLPQAGGSSLGLSYVAETAVLTLSVTSQEGAGGPAAVRLLYDERYREAGWIVQLLALGSWFAVLEVTNTIHPIGADLPIAKSLKGHYDDADWGLSFDNTGKNGHFRAFNWAA